MQSSDLELSDLASKASCVDDYDPNAMSVTQARHYIQQFLSPVSETETVTLKDSLGRFLAKPVISGMNVPGHNNSAMDGFAFRHAEGGNPLNVIGTAFAGAPFTSEIPAGCCIKIMTGAVIPPTVDTVIMQEQTSTEGELVTLVKLPALGANIRLTGEDVAIGQTVLTPGHRIEPADMGLLASLGIGEIEVYRRLKVAFFSTGDELVSVGKPLQQGQIYDSNRYSLWGVLEAIGVSVTDLGNVADDPTALEKTLLEAASGYDVVITSGGVSVGEADFMKQLLAKHGQVLFWKINMKPGRPLAYGKIGTAHYFGLPGNPVSAMVTFYQFVQEALKTLMGAAHLATPSFQVECVNAIKKATGRTEFQRGILFKEGETWKVKTTGEQGSGILSSMSRANCFIVLNEQTGALEAGTLVEVQPFHGVC
ncbi:MULTISPECIES: gephyrin-like molybdotransferase Glp [unclassified Methylophilus]|uniref:molybdopterin molybdotransferase MoeA n=1 Tax=unclassified Methylophilus TaxID=2630143 RepID=UPI000701312A|nr:MULTISPECIES: gephyrin-like molybdotransferase Glp [unclassified Methylophilus]KQT42393.1 molybdopterin molybdenumtransferase [Methylophilus sp. Leaf416]KQT56576.1 molybdopterin molybdenumtransferase [Methylophilus sp. Leaf459]